MPQTVAEQVLWEAESEYRQYQHLQKKHRRNLRNALRKAAKHHTQTAIAGRLGVSQGYISKLLNDS